MMRAGALFFSRWRRSLLSRNGARWLTAQVSSMPSFVSFCRRQPNAIGARDQHLLVVHGTAIQRYGDARVTCPMVRTQPLTMSVRTGGAPGSSSSTHTPIGAFKGAAALGKRANTCIVARDLINALHNADGRGKEDFPPRGA